MLIDRLLLTCYLTTYILIYGAIAGITQKSAVAACPLRSLQKQNGLIKRSENNMNNIIGISIAYWRVHLR